MAKEIFPEMAATGKRSGAIIEEKGLKQTEGGANPRLTRKILKEKLDG